jgi:diguanylate cyclase
MPLAYISREELQKILGHLDQALYNHVQWHNTLIRTLICRMPGNKHDMKPDAHTQCLFGQWYYEDAPEKLKNHPGFMALGDAHKHMHQLASQLLLTVQAGSSIDPLDYDSFANAMERLRLELASLKHEIEISLYTHDPLTGAINRSDMLPILRELHEMVRRQSQVCTLVMMDLDSFKSINDKFGHPAGDKVLIAVVQYITEHLRPYDKLFRYGGEEFLLCLQQTELSDCYERIETLRQGLGVLPIDIGREEPVQITSSFGITGLDPFSEVEECLERVDKALYTAKREGKNCVRVWESSFQKIISK